MRFLFGGQKTLTIEAAAVTLAFFLTSLILLTGCGRKASPRLPGMKPMPVVADLHYQLTGGDVTLVWSVPPLEGDAADISGFSVYRAQRPAADARCATCPFPYRRVATVPFGEGDMGGDQRWEVRYRETLPAGHHYAYRVRVIGKGNNEGELSEPISFVYE
jgi:hypothetical protein